MSAHERGRRPLRVCHLAYSFYETDNRVRRYADALADRGDTVDVIALRRPGQSRLGEIRGVRVLRIQQRKVTERWAATYLLKILVFMVRSAIVLTRRHLSRPYDVVHVHNVPDFLVFGALLTKLLGARVVLDIHDVLPELFAGKFGADSVSMPFRALLQVERMSCRFADRVIVANHVWEARLIERSVPAEKCSTIMNYPDLRLFAAANGRARPENGPFVMLYPGSLNRYQGVDVAVKALALIKDRIPEAELHVYGEGPAVGDLIQLARQSGLGERFKLMAPLPIEAIARVMADADLGIEPKLSEGFSNEALSTKILEFMACGVPVIASRTLVHSRYFGGDLLCFFAPGDEVDLASKIVEVHAQRSQQAGKLSRAREFAVKHSWQERMTDYVALIDGLVQEPRLAVSL